LYTFCNFSLGYEEAPSVLLILGCGLFLIAFGLAVWYRGNRHWRLILLSSMGVPVFVTLMVSLRRPYYMDRYLTVVLPGFLAWITLGVTMLPSRWRHLVVGAMVVISAWATMGVLAGARYQKEDWRSAVGQVRDLAHPKDSLFVVGPEDVPVSAYYLDGALPLEVGLPEPSAGGRVWFLYRIPVESNHLLGESAQSGLLTQADPIVRAWLVRNEEQMVGKWQYPGLALFLLEMSPQG
jgi:hypothetical protein